MKRVLVMLALILPLAGCANMEMPEVVEDALITLLEDRIEERAAEEEKDKEDDKEKEEEKETEEATEEVSEEASDESSESVQSSEATTEKAEAAGEESLYTWEEISVIIPAEWSGKYIIEEESDGFTFYLKSSYEYEPGSGYICGFVRRDNMLSWPGAGILAYTSQYVYYINYPTDVPCASRQDIMNEYMEVCNYQDKLRNSVKITADGLYTEVEEYILPTSWLKPLPEAVVMSMSAEELKLARNEIYARHGRKFNDDTLQNYFNSRSWYTPTIEAGNFTESMLSQVERDNIDLIKKWEDEHKKNGF